MTKLKTSFTTVTWHDNNMTCDRLKIYRKK